MAGDKSISHRAALLAVLAEGDSHISNFLDAGVTRAMLNALAQLGVDWQLQDGNLLVKGRGFGSLRSPTSPLDCGNSATTMRLLTGALAATNTPAILDGSPGLRNRPMSRIVLPLQQMGVCIEATDGHAPLILNRSSFPLKPLHYEMPVASSQVKSCLLLAALSANGKTLLIEPVRSRDHTERMLNALGVKVTSHALVPQPRITVERIRFEVALYPSQPFALPPLTVNLPGDISSAAFFIVAASIVPHSEILLRNVGINPTRTGLIDVLQQMGAQIDIQPKEVRHGEPVGDITVRYSKLSGTQVFGETVVRMIDEFPIFAVAAAMAHGETVVRDAHELRHKESDRIGALCQELCHIGLEVQETPDGFIIQGPQKVKGGEADSHGDHRLAMTLAIAGLVSEHPVNVANAEVITESLPSFPSILQSLGANVRLNEVSK